jgi:hypothetical protein
MTKIRVFRIHLLAVTAGIVQTQAANLTNEQKRRLAEYMLGWRRARRMERVRRRIDRSIGPTIAPGNVLSAFGIE